IASKSPQATLYVKNDRGFMREPRSLYKVIRWEIEISGVFSIVFVRPSFRYRFRLGKEAGRIRTKHLSITETGIFPAAKIMITYRNRNRYVDAYHPYSYILFKVAGIFSAVCKYRHAIAVLMVIN